MKILDAGRGVAGAYCAGMLRLIGAEVTRVRSVGILAPAGHEEAIDEALDRYLHRGKRLLPHELRLPEQRARFLELVAGADCLVEDWAPGGLEACGLDETALRRVQPQLVLTRISEFGQTGPWAARAGSELVNLAAGGMLFLTGSWDRPPVQLAPYQAQLTAGLLAAVATSAALYGGGPITIDLSRQESVLALITPALSEYVYQGTIPAREGRVAAMARIERARDGWVYAGPGAAANADYQAYSAFLGIPEFAEPRFATPNGRMENWEEHQRLLQPRLLEKDAGEWVDAAAESRLTFGLVQTTTDLLHSGVLQERRFFDEREVGGSHARVPLAPYLVDGERPDTLQSPPEAAN